MTSYSIDRINLCFICLISYDFLSNSSTLSGQASLSTRTSSSFPSETFPNALRLCLVSRDGLVSFFRWFPQRRRSEEERNLRGVFDLTSDPQAIALSPDRICIAYDHSYVIFDAIAGEIINELILTKRQKPMISCFKDSNQWCIKVDTSSIFFKSNFDIIYDREIVWEDIPSTVIQSTPYILASINQSIHICLFDGTQFIIVQRVPLISSLTNDKCQLWMDAQSKRIYITTLKDVFLLEPQSIHIQVQEYIDMHKYDVALIVIRAALDISDSSSTNDQPRTTNGHAKGNLDPSELPKVEIFSNNLHVSTGVIIHIF